MQLFYAPDITPPLYTLNEEESKHCVRVLRLTSGDTLHITDGRGNLYRTVIEDDNPKRCTVKVVETISEFEKRNYDLTMAVAPTKNIDRFEWFLEKATETGIDHIIPLECKHSERRTINSDRLTKVITSAVKQSLKAYHPTLDEMTTFQELLNSLSKSNGSAKFAGKKLIAHCREGERKFIGDCIEKGDSVLVLIGPEGDFSQEEVDLAIKAGFTPITLGDSRLRTETAALSVVTITSFINH